MSFLNNYNPNIAIHPGVTLDELLLSHEMTQADLATRTGLTVKTINEIIKGKNPITPETAIKLSSVFGMSDSFWDNLEKNYQAVQARIKQEKALEKNVKLLKKFSCYSELVNFNYVKKTNKPKEKVVNLQKFFGVSDLSYVYKVMPIAFRKVDGKNINYESIAAWLRCGELEAQKTETSKFNKEKLIKAIPKLRELTILDPKIYSQKIKKICADFGVVVAYTPYFKNTYVNAATKWLDKDKSLIQLNLRGSYSDIFWFSFFHELAHILKHGKRDQFIEFKEKGFKVDKEKEKEADDYAMETLIPKDEYNKFIEKKNFTGPSIKAFAKKIGISYGVVAGRLAHDLNKWKSFEYLRSIL